MTIVARFLIPALAAALALAAPPAALHAQGAGQPPHPGIPAAATVAAHVGDCIAATSARGIDLATLRDRGWTGSEAHDDRGNVPFVLFTRSGDLTMMSAWNGANARQCMVMSPAGDVAGIEAIRQAIDASLTVERSVDDAAETVWMTPTHHVVATPMVNAQVQGMKVVVTSLERE